MVTEKQMMQVIENYSNDSKTRVALAVTPEDMKRFKKNTKLPLLIADRKRKNDTDHNVSATAGYDLIEEMCLISITSLKRTINGSDRPTRTFLYKFTVGLKLSVEEANTFFELCGGALREENPEDFICIRALEDEDDIHLFCDQFEQYIHKKLAR